MNLNSMQIKTLKSLMTNSANKGNLANAGLVVEKGKTVASAESLVASKPDATAHSERMLVEQVCKMKNTNYTPGLEMVTVVEPCLMCMSACSQAGYSKVYFIIPAEKYVDKIFYMTDTTKINKYEIAKNFTDPIELIHLKDYEQEFCEVFEKVMQHELNK